MEFQLPLGNSIIIGRPATKDDCIEIKRLIQVSSFSHNDFII